MYEGNKTIKKAEEYIDSCVDSMERSVESENEKTGRKRFSSKVKVRLPKSEGLALHLGVSRTRIYEWAKEHDEFRAILERLNQIQADRVFNEALAGNYNPMISKLLLGKHGYKDSSEVDHRFPEVDDDTKEKIKGAVGEILE